MHYFGRLPTNLKAQPWWHRFCWKQRFRKIMTSYFNNWVFLSEKPNYIMNKIITLNSVILNNLLRNFYSNLTDLCQVCYSIKIKFIWSLFHCFTNISNIQETLSNPRKIQFVWGKHCTIFLILARLYVIFSNLVSVCIV